MDRSRILEPSHFPDEEHAKLLERHMPVIAYDQRELFLPSAVENYIARVDLMCRDEVLYPAGSLTEFELDHTLPDGTYMKFVSDLERRAVVAEEAKRLAGKMLGPRLGRVGLFGRILDAIFLVSVVLRSTTPGRTTVAAALKVERYGLQQSNVCYGRVVNIGHWMVLHYAYFYVMNDWRSGYRGLNDHEGDWEQAWIFCDPLTREPIWVAASSHDHNGPDLRRHWNDTECIKDGNRPLLYAGAGSHALYFRPGDYVTRIDVAALRWLFRLQRWFRRVMRIGDPAAERGMGPALGMPFVDAATGDGKKISEWELHYLDERRSCLGGYRGLWGLDTGDPTGGERGPGGPKFTRSGTFRQSWVDPVGFVGLHYSSPPSLAPAEDTLDNIHVAMDQLDQEINRVSRLLPLVQQTEPMTDEGDTEHMTALLGKRARLADLAYRLETGEAATPNMRAHLKNPAVPLSPLEGPSWILALWAASSVPLLMFAVAATLLGQGITLSTLILVITAGFSLLEQLVRGNFHAVARLVVIYGALIGSFSLYGYFNDEVGSLFKSLENVSIYAIGVATVAAAVGLLVVNLNEVVAVQKRSRHLAEAERRAVTERLHSIDSDYSPNPK